MTNAELQLRVVSDSVDTANRRLDELEKKGRKAEKASSGLMDQFKKMAGAALAVVGALEGLNKLVEVQRNFDKLNAGLVTATGSAANAAEAFAALQQFAQKTPYDLNQAVEGFTQLVNLGLDPSEKAMLSYGNTASAMGKDLNQMIEAVADAATGEFERLKEFGIKASQQGDKVTFLFQNVKTTVGNNAQEIEKYLQSLGETKFAGAMEERMKTLDGAIANFEDTWENLVLKISQSGFGDAAAEGFRMAADGLQELTDMVASGQLMGYIEAIATSFDGYGRDMQASWKALSDYLSSTQDSWGPILKANIDNMVKTFKEFPENVRAFIQIMTVEILAGYDKASAYTRAFIDGVKAIVNDDTWEGVGQRLETQLKLVNGVREDSIAGILAERDADIAASQAKGKAADELRKKYEEQQKANGAKGDVLGKYRAPAAKNDQPTKAQQDAAKAAKKEYDALVASLMTEEEAVKASYEKRKAIIEKNTKEGSDARTNLMTRLEKDYDEQLTKAKTNATAETDAIKQELMTQEQAIQASYEKRLAIIQKSNLSDDDKLNLSLGVAADKDTDMEALEEANRQKRDALYNGLLTEEEAMKQSYDRRKEQILKATEITEVERQDLLARLEKDFKQKQETAEQERMASQLGLASQMFDGLAGVAKAAGGEQSKAYKALFAISKAFSVAQATMSMVTGMAKAQELGFPMNIVEMARVAATGAGLLSQIKGSNFSGSYDEGGNIPAGKIGIVGEYGPELVQGPSRITGRRKTADELAGGGGRNDIQIINNNGSNVRVERQQTDEGERMKFYIEEAKKSIAQDMVAGTGALPRAFEGTYMSMKRGQQ